jgi:hypothetical protein
MAMGIRNAALSIEYSTGKKQNAGQQLKGSLRDPYSTGLGATLYEIYSSNPHLAGDNVGEWSTPSWKP